MTLKTTWVTGETLAASDVNDIATAANSAPALAAAFVGGAQTAFVATTENFGSATYGDLTTITDKVTVTVGASGILLVAITCVMAYVSGSGGSPVVSFALSGANTKAGSDEYSAWQALNAPGTSLCLPVFGLSPGSTVVKMKYKSSAGSATFAFSNRRIMVIPFP